MIQTWNAVNDDKWIPPLQILIGQIADMKLVRNNAKIMIIKGENLILKLSITKHGMENETFERIVFSS